MTHYLIMPAKQTRQKVQKEARREARREAERSEALAARQRRFVVLMQMYFRLMFVAIPNDLYTHLQILLRNREPADVAFRHCVYRRVDRATYSLRYPGRVLSREGEVFVFSRHGLEALNLHAGRDRFAMMVEWTLRISPYAPVRIYTVMFRQDPARDGPGLPLQKDWILYMQARTELHHGNSIYDLSLGKWAYHFYDPEVANAYLERIIPSE